MAAANGSQSAGLDGDEDWPPGFRFHPMDEELVLYYLKRKICGKWLKLNVIAETDVYKWDPEELPGLSLIKSGDRQWFFFTPRDRKYPNGAWSNRGTTKGYWKATGKDRCISYNSRSVGLKKTLVFYRGRAPHGERTDWVMHEYTLDEEELKRCQNVQEYFALYKVFKKSGAGPKNGEQYGAPFREEAWNYDCPDFNTSASRDIPIEKVDEGLPNGGVKVDCQPPPFSDDLEELLKNLTEEPLPELPANDYNHTPSQVLRQEDVQIGTTVDLCINHEPVNVFYGNGVQRNLQVSFDLTQSTDPQVQLYEAPEVASEASKVEEQGVFVLPGEDFIEMDDLLGPELIMDSVDVEETLNGILVNEANGLCDFDLYHDAAMFLNDIGANHCEAVGQYDYHLNSNQLGPGGVVDQLYVGASGGVVNQPYLQVPDTVNQLYPSNVNQINNQLYPNEASLSYSQEGSVLTSAEFYEEHYSAPTSGVVSGSSNTSLQANQNQNQNQNQGGNEDNGATSWFSSAMWSFVESIPTTPASAAENALVNRAFGRMSSFSRLRMNATSANVTAGSDSETIQSSCSKRGFILFPVIVAVLAISWVVLGAVNVWGTGISA